MLETFFTVAFALLAIIGTADLVHRLLYWMLKTDQEGTLYLVLTFSGHEERAEMILSGAVERLHLTAGQDKRILCIDNGMDEETRRICETVSLQHPCIRLCTPQEAKEILTCQV